MPELRVAICSSDKMDVDGIAMRLRGATVKECKVSTEMKEFDFIVCLDWSKAANFLEENSFVLVVADPCPPANVIEDLVAKYNSRISIVNPDRYLPSRQLIRKQIPAQIGEPGLVRLHRWEPISSRAIESAGLPNPLIRDIDVVLWLVGKFPDRVYSVEHMPATANRFVQVHLGFPGGGMALIDYDGRLPAGDGYQSLSVIGATGATYADDHQNMQLVYSGGQPRGVRTEERARVLAAIVQDFIDDLTAGHERKGNLADWRNAFTVADAIRQALQSHCVVALEGR